MKNTFQEIKSASKKDQTDCDVKDLKESSIEV